MLAVTDEEIWVKGGNDVYFARSCACCDGPETVAAADYGRPIAAAVRAGNWWGAQFHPERSGEPGARFLKAFLGA